MRMRIRESFWPWIRDKHPGSATLFTSYQQCGIYKEISPPAKQNCKIFDS
jgi:hypothetical protein